MFTAGQNNTLIQVRNLHNFVPNSRVDAHGPGRSLINRSLPLGFLRISRRHGHLILDRHQTLMRHGVGNLRINRIILNTIHNLGPCNTFVSVNNIDNLLRVSRVSRSRVSAPRDILGIGSRVGIVVVSLSTRHNQVSLSAGRLRPRPNSVIGGPSLICSGTRRVTTGCHRGLHGRTTRGRTTLRNGSIRICRSRRRITLTIS